jgi:DNA replicative helicase MCM subunit Mcm2 (Cdc46/Mcm family)
MIVEIVQEVEKEYGNEVPVKEILDLAEESRIEREKAEKAIDEPQGKPQI